MRWDVVLGPLLFLSSFYPHFTLSVLVVYALAYYIGAKDFPPLVSAFLIPFSPVHALLTLLPYPLLFVKDRPFTLTLLLSTFFALVTGNYLILTLSVLERKGLITSAIIFLISSAVFLDQAVSLGNIAFFLLVAGVISSILESKFHFSLRTRGAIFLSSLAVYFHQPWLVPLLSSVSPLIALVYSPFNPWLVSVAPLHLEKRWKWSWIVPVIASFFSPVISLSLVTKKVVYGLIGLFVVSLVLFALGMYTGVEIVSLALIGSVTWSYVKKVAGKMRGIPIRIVLAIALQGLALLYYSDLFRFVLLSLVAISFVAPKMNVRALSFSVLSLLNPFAGLGEAVPYFLVVPLVGVIYFHFPVISWVIYAVGSLLDWLPNRKIKAKFAFLAVACIYLGYSLYLFGGGNEVMSTYFSVLGAGSAILSMREWGDSTLRSVLRYIGVSLPFPVLGLPFFAMRKYDLLVVEAVVVILVVKYLSVASFLFIA
ncbi:MAG: hypothetical protein OWQ52_12845 [Metallosphaera prunae]|uniref:hypothetical protein n=1 Tax=Metallosphaera prunae TaxID=47304 RepID=UPI002273F984|nr:hypothetical protein [Metallosphaera prunae]MCY0863295.1 hypothetical protein [Metallosphaera prunae]